MMTRFGTGSTSKHRSMQGPQYFTSDKAHDFQDQPASYDRQTLVHEWFSLVEYQTTVNKNLL
jgi:hypothetical protein